MYYVDHTKYKYNKQNLRTQYENMLKPTYKHMPNNLLVILPQDCQYRKFYLEIDDRKVRPWLKIMQIIAGKRQRYWTVPFYLYNVPCSHH